MKGCFIIFEGPDGAGKTTQIKILADNLREKGFAVVLTREPGGCPISDKIRSVLLDADNVDMCHRTELILFAAARAQHVHDVILPALERDDVVLCDRFTASTQAYQGARGLDDRPIRWLNKFAVSDVTPNLTILLDLPVEIGLQRSFERHNGSGKEARMEFEKVAFHQRVRDAYLGMAKLDPNHYRLVDATKPKEIVAGDIAAMVDEYLIGIRDKGDYDA